MFFLIPSLTIGWAFWDLEGLHLLALKEFSREQLHVSTLFFGVDGIVIKGNMVIMCPNQAMGTDWAALGHRSWEVELLLMVQEREGVLLLFF